MAVKKKLVKAERITKEERRLKRNYKDIQKDKLMFLLSQKMFGKEHTILFYKENEYVRKQSCIWFKKCTLCTDYSWGRWN
ncbi:hypothetical protein KZO01_16400 [Kurthia zopfii]|nr:hypothetical protein KZO01_16400 [Kurthia zopfii]